jgi:dTDP-4-amino-4,6-dideoxygalactose transaminase
MIREFEEKFAEYIGTKYAICMTSGRYALYLLYTHFRCRDKKVILPAYTCIPAIDAARWAGAEPKFLDISLEDYNPVFDPAISRWQNIGAICLSYLYGLIGDLDPLLEFARVRQIPIIEDAAIALGGQYRNKKVGSLGDAAVFSLQSSKILTSWKGGIITTNDESLYSFLYQERERLPKPSAAKLLMNIFTTYMRSFFAKPAIYSLTFFPLKRIVFSRPFSRLFQAVIDQNPTEALSGESSEFLPYYETLRYSNIQAAMARASFEKIDTIIQKRRTLANFLNRELSGIDIIKIPAENENVKHAYGRYPIRISGFSKYTIEKYLSKYGIETALNYPYICPQTPFLKKFDVGSGHYPHAAVASQETILLPFHTRLDEQDIHRISLVIKAFADLHN